MSDTSDVYEAIDENMDESYDDAEEQGNECEDESTDKSDDSEEECSGHMEDEWVEESGEKSSDESTCDSIAPGESGVRSDDVTAEAIGASCDLSPDVIDVVGTQSSSMDYSQSQDIVLSGSNEVPRYIIHMIDSMIGTSNRFTVAPNPVLFDCIEIFVT